MKRFFTDFYGSTASITEHRDLSATLKIADAHGKPVFGKVYGSYTAARRALSRYGDCWKEKEVIT